MRHLLYRAEDWIRPAKASFIFPHAKNRPLNPEAHSHDFYEITFLFEGEVTQIIDGNEFQMYAGEAAFISPLQIHQFTKQTDILDFYTLSVMKEEMDPFLHAYHLEKLIAGSVQPVRFAMSQATRHRIGDLFRDLSVVTPDRQIIDVRIIIGLTLQEYLLSANGYTSNWVNQLAQQMNTQENLEEGVNAMVRLSGLSHAQLCRNLKKANGKTPQQMLKELRLSYAYELICSSEIPYEEIASSVGYSSFSHFSVTFKERYGITPSVLRKTSPQSMLL